MKNVKLIFTSMMISALMFITSMTFANPFGVVSHIAVVQKDNGNKSISVRIPYSDSPKVMITLKDKNDFTLFSERAKGKDGFAKELNVNSLPNGIYYITIEDNEKITKQAFRIDFEEVILKEYKKETVQKPTFQYDARRQMALLNVVADGTIEVKMLTQDGDNLFASNSTNQFEKTFNLKRLQQGNYTFVMSYGGETFYEYISVR
ncbi:MAG: hypothetical protein R3E32_19200 [Chitinophagales bacterium]